MDDKWNICSWNNFDDDDDTPAGEPAAGDYNLDDVVSVLVVEDRLCPRCFSERIIANWKNPTKMCCVDCGILFDYE